MHIGDRILIYGVGMLIGSLISGRTVDYFTHTVGTEVTRNWQAFWMTSAFERFYYLAPDRSLLPQRQQN